jgi:hypothetical protein
VPTPANALGPGSGRGVERTRRGCPPVDEQRLVVALFIEQAQPPHIALPVAVLVFVTVQVQAPEAQALLDTVESGQLLRIHRRGGIPLGERLRGTGSRGAQHLGEPLGGVPAALVEVPVEHGEIVLLQRHIGV